MALSKENMIVDAHQTAAQVEFMDVNQGHTSQLAKASVEEKDQPIYLPIDAVVRIFSFLTRDEVDICRRVSKTWLDIIDTHNADMPKREIDCIELSTDHEFSIKVWYENKIIQYACKKYYSDLDIDGFEVDTKRKHKLGRFNLARDVTLPCGARLHLEHRRNFEFHQWDPFHGQYCKHRKNMIYKRGRRYGKKLFTPPLAFYEQLEYVLRNANVKTLIMAKFTFTELFVEKFLEFLPGGLPLDLLYMHNVKLRYISPETFHKFLNDAAPAKNYVFDQMTYILPNHINSELLKKPSILRAHTLHVDNCSSRVGGLLTLNISPQAFYEFVTYHDPNDDKPVQREFVGIARSRVEDDNKILNEVSKVYRRDPKSSHFKHILIGHLRLLEGVLMVPPQANPNAQQQQQQHQQAFMNQFM